MSSEDSLTEILVTLLLCLFIFCYCEEFWLSEIMDQVGKSVDQLEKSMDQTSMDKVTDQMARSMVNRTISMKKSKRNWLCTGRFLIALLLAGGYASIEVVQSTIGMAIVCMLNQTTISNTSSNFSHEIQTTCSFGDTAEVDYGGTFVWSSLAQSLVLSSFQWGVLTAPLAGWMADKMNSKWMLMFSVGITGLGSLLIPLLAHFSFVYVVICRVIMGIGEAALISTVNALVTKWYPSNERNVALGIGIGGRQIGALLIFPLAGFFCSRKDILGGWPAMFYFAAAFDLCWMIFWIILGGDQPSRAFWMRKHEVDEIEQANAMEKKVDKEMKSPRTPWRRLFGSVPLWANALSVLCQEYPQITLALYLPSYLKDAFQIPSSTNGLISALPLVFMFVGRLVTSALSDVLQSRLAIDKTLLAKICNSLGAVGVGGFLAATTLLDCRHYAVIVVFICAGMAFSGFHTPGCLGTLVSIAPAHSGAITGITWFMIAVAGILNPIITEAMVVRGTKSEWNTVFYVNAVVSFAPVLIFNLFGTAKLQPWAEENDEVVDSGEKSIVNNHV